MPAITVAESAWYVNGLVVRVYCVAIVKGIISIGCGLSLPLSEIDENLT